MCIPLFLLSLFPRLYIWWFSSKWRFKTPYTSNRIAFFLWGKLTSLWFSCSHFSDKPHGVSIGVVMTWSSLQTGRIWTEVQWRLVMLDISICTAGLAHEKGRQMGARNTFRPISIPAAMHKHPLLNTMMVRCDCIQHLPEYKQPRVDTCSSHFLEYVEQLKCSWYSICVLDMHIPTTKQK